MKVIFSVASFAILAGCAATGEYPLLAKRPFETATTSPPTAAEPSLTPSNPELLARVSAQLAAARASAAPFDEQLSKSQAQVIGAAGAAEGSERWIEGQLGASRLEPLLAAAANAAAVIGDEYRAQMLLPPSADLAAVEAAFVEATAVADRQARASAELTARLSR